MGQSLVGIIVLANDQDLIIKLVPLAAIDFIAKPFAGHDGATSAEEQLPADLRQDYMALGLLGDRDSLDAEVNTTADRYANDRALELPGQPFDTLVAAFEAARSKGWLIAGEFIGSIY